MSFQFAVAGLGYVGLSNAVLLSQRFPVIACDVSAERVDLINAKQSPIIDPELQDYLASKPLDLKATLDPREAYGQATHVIIATPTNYDPDTNAFDTSTVEQVIKQVLDLNDQALIVIKSTIPVGLVNRLRDQFKTDRIIFSPPPPPPPPSSCARAKPCTTISTPRASSLASVPSVARLSPGRWPTAPSRSTFRFSSPIRRKRKP